MSAEIIPFRPKNSEAEIQSPDTEQNTKGEHALLIRGLFTPELMLHELGQHLKNNSIQPYQLEGFYHDHLGIFGAALIERDVERKVKKLTDEIGEPISIVGHSWGGRIAAVTQQRHPELIKTVVAIGAPIADIVAPRGRQAKTIFTNTDMVVPWWLSINPTFTRHYFVPFKEHFSMTSDPDVQKIVYSTLASPQNPSILRTQSRQ